MLRNRLRPTRVYARNLRCLCSPGRASECPYLLNCHNCHGEGYAQEEGKGCRLFREYISHILSRIFRLTYRTIQKSKLKLGKGKQLPTNAVDTSFKARSIALPSQSIASSKPSSEPTTKRKLSLDDLLTQLKHYSPSTRRDALSGLRELLTAHPALLLPALPRLLTSTARLISDDDQSVRKALLSLLSYILPTAGPESLAPHAPSLLLFTASAQTHIFPAVALDAVRLLDLLLDILPEVVATPRVLQGYLSLLSAGTAFGADELGEAKATSTASVVLSPPSRAVVFKALARFLRVFLGQDGKTAKEGLDTSFLRPHFESEKAYEAFDRLLRPHGVPEAVWTPRADAADDFFVVEVAGGFELDAGPSLRDLSSLQADEQDGGLSYQAVSPLVLPVST